MTRVKICGITNVNDAQKAAHLGAWAVGFIFHKKSPRFVGPYKAQKIIAALPPFVTPVGVFVNQKEGAVMDIADFCRLSVLQFHGDEGPGYFRRFKKYKTIKAFRVKEDFRSSDLKDYPVDAFLFDSYVKDQYGGTGEAFDWSLIKPAKSLGKPIILSGGLNSANIKQAVEEVQPYAVDVSSGVESAPGQKDERAMKALFDQLLIQ